MILVMNIIIFSLNSSRTVSLVQWMDRNFAITSFNVMF